MSNPKIENPGENILSSGLHLFVEVNIYYEMKNLLEINLEEDMPPYLGTPMQEFALRLRLNED